MRALALGWLMLVVPLAGRADDGAALDADVRRRFELANRLYAQGNKEQALDELQRLAAQLERPAVLVNLVLISAELGRCELAVETADRLLANPGKLDAARLERVRQVRTEQAAKLGEVVVSTPVEGVEVFLGARRLGTTPLRGPVLASAGRVVLAARASRYQPVYRELLVPPSGRLEVVLELKSSVVNTGAVRLRTSTPGAEVFVDGRLVGLTPSLTRLAVLPGERTVSLRREGYLSAEAKLTVPEGGEVEVQLDPTPDPGRTELVGAVTVRASQSQVTWSVDGRRLGLLSDRPVDLVAGPHLLEFERGGFFTIRRPVVVAQAGRVDLELRFEPTTEYRAELEATRALRRTLGFSGLGVGLAGAALSSWYVFGYVSGERLYWQAQRAQAGAEADSRTGCFQNTDPKVPSCTQTIERATSKLSELRTLEALGITGQVVSGLLLVGGVLALLLAPDLSVYDATPTTPAFVPELGLALVPGGAEVVAGGRF